MASDKTAAAGSRERIGVSAVPAISVRSLSKAFGGIRAVNDVSLAVAHGTVHALVGANGAGKSTLLNIIAGRTKADAGAIWLNGRPAKFDTPRQARQAGICSIYQELTIIRALSAMANVFLGQEQTRLGFLSESLMETRYQRLCLRLGVNIAPGVLARRLSVADQQALEIMRGLASGADVILFDEPTTALAPAERDALFQAIRGLRRDGVTTILVSHNLEEVLDISDVITVFRDGHCVATKSRSEWNKKQLVQAMIGRDLLEAETLHQPRLPKRAKTVLRAEHINVPGAIFNAALKVRAGEIVGIGGLVGSGRTSLLRALAGLAAGSSGEIVIDGVPMPWPRSPRTAIGYGIALVPEDRKMQGLVGSLSALDNLTLADLSRASSLGIIQEPERREIAGRVAKSFGLDPRRLGDRVKTLSGGNQQKVVLARWSYKVPLVLLIDEPTRGIDVGAKEEILNAIRALASGGLAVIIVSSEIEELVTISDRVIVLAGGRVVRELGATVEFDASAVMKAAFGDMNEND